MNLPKQSRPVIRDVSRDPLRARVQGSAPVTPPPPFDPCGHLPIPLNWICEAALHIIII
jgi:hypothetical protein